MPRAKTPIHGRDHHPGKSDPIKEMIVFDYDNLGEWLNIVTTGAETGSQGINLETQNGNDIDITADPDGDGFVNISGGKVALSGGINGVVIDGSSHVFITADPAGGGIELRALTLVRFQTGTDTFTVSDHLGNPIFRVDDNGDVHIKTGKTITADL